VVLVIKEAKRDFLFALKLDCLPTCQNRLREEVIYFQITIPSFVTNFRINKQRKTNIKTNGFVKGHEAFGN
jgi:hypothetical protein